tara:strand:+ start:209 stop:406 length:198 start_codon:yes stop_codon:yes gene_type:complete
MLTKQCKLHLKQVDETAIQHMIAALKIAVELQYLVLVLIIHAFVPRWFTTTASRTMMRIINERTN